MDKLENIVITWKDLRKTSEDDFKFGKNDILTGNLNYLAPSLLPALAADYCGLFGNYGHIDSSLTITAALGAMAGFFGRYKDAATLAFLTYTSGMAVTVAYDFLTDFRFNGNPKAPEGFNIGLETNAFVFFGSLIAAYVLKNFVKKIV